MAIHTRPVKKQAPVGSNARDLLDFDEKCPIYLTRCRYGFRHSQIQVSFSSKKIKRIVSCHCSNFDIRSSQTTAKMRPLK